MVFLCVVRYGSSFRFPFLFPVLGRGKMHDFLKLPVEGGQGGIPASFGYGEDGLVAALQCRTGMTDPDPVEKGNGRFPERIHKQPAQIGGTDKAERAQLFGGDVLHVMMEHILHGRLNPLPVRASGIILFLRRQLCISLHFQ